jgi:hypothetical protein
MMPYGGFEETNCCSGGCAAPKTVHVPFDNVPLITLYESMTDKGFFSRKGPNSAGEGLIYEWAN